MNYRFCISFCFASMLAQIAHATVSDCPSYHNTYPLSGVAVFDGSLKEKLNLPPNTSKGKSKTDFTYALWNVGHLYDEGHKVSLACKFQGGKDAVIVKIDNKVESCVYHAGARHKIRSDDVSPASIKCE